MFSNQRERKGVCRQVLQRGILSTPTNLNKRSPGLVVQFAPLGLARLLPSYCRVSVSECGVELMDDGKSRQQEILVGNNVKP